MCIRPSRKFATRAQGFKHSTGKATATIITVNSPQLWGATREEALAAQEQWCATFLAPMQRAKKPKLEQVQAHTLERERRSAAPTDLAEAVGPQRPRAPVAGAGRGHCYETMPAKVEEPTMLPPAGAAAANWLEQLRLKKEWQSAELARLERELACALSVVAAQADTIAALRARVAELEVSLPLPSSPTTPPSLGAMRRV